MNPPALGMYLVCGLISFAHAAPAGSSLEQARGHWAYQPLARQAPPAIANAGDATPVDAFVLRRLEAAGLSLAPQADRRTLIRRAYYDLIGLPPGHDETEQFASDPAPDAYERLVDRLLAMPQYGERWGRHWLDVARYADTKDLVLQYGKDALRPYAYTYRDYVVRSFNQDTPFDQFIREQIAADLIEPAVEPWKLAALGFLTLGRLYDNNPHDQIDDQIDTVTRGFLGLTVSCARCHDHKYDAIPTADYYALYGVFASSERPYDLPLIEDPAEVEGGLEFEQKLREARETLEAHVEAEYVKLRQTAQERTADYLVAVATTPPDLAESSTFFLSLSPEDLRPALLNRWRRYVRERSQPEHPVFGPWSALMSLPEDRFAEQAARVLEESHPAWNRLVLKALKQSPVTSREGAARRYGELLAEVAGRASEGTDLTEAERELAAIFAGSESPIYFPKNQTYLQMSRVEVDRYNGLVGELDKIAARAEKRPPARAMVVRDAREPHEPRVFIRGSPAQLGEPVPRAFLTVLSTGQPRPFTQGSGRLELAEAIAAPENPLTARVMANRIWMHHFGRPLVSSPSDFGTRSDPPTHPELLDYLAGRFIELGWSVKRLHKEIMLSRAYRQSSADRPECRAVDPENRLLWRAERRRLELESMRDTLLQVAGRLDARMGGPSVDAAHDPLNARRTLYGLVDRQNLPGMYRAFDFVCPDQSVEMRPVTNVPQQALFAMNSPFVLEQARALIASPEVAQCQEPEARVQTLYRQVLGREAAPEELARAIDFVEGVPPPGEGELPAWEQFAQVLLMTNELMFVD